MAVANTLDYYDTASIMAVKRFYVKGFWWQLWYLDLNSRPWDGEVGVLPLYYPHWSFCISELTSLSLKIFLVKSLYH
jgi:hypothetical protein